MAETEKNHIHRIIFEESGRQPVLSSIATLKKGLEDLNNVSKIKIELEDVNIVENFKKITSKIKSSPNLKISVPLEIQYSDSLKKLQTNLNQFLHSSKSEFDSLNPKIDLTLETLTNIRNLDFKNVNKHFFTLRNFSAGVADNFERISQSKLYQGQNPIVDLAINEVVSAANKTNLSSTLDISPLSAALDDQAQKIKTSILGGAGQKNVGSQKDCCDVIEKLVTNSDHLLEMLSYGFDQLLSGKIDLKTSNTGNAGTTTVSSENVEKQKIAEEERLWEETAKLELKKMHLDDQQIDAALKNIKKYKTSNNQMLSLWDRLGKGLKNFVSIEDAVVRQTSKLYYIQLRNAELEKERGEKGSLSFFKTAELGIMTFLKKASSIGVGVDIAGGLVNKLAGAINPIFKLILEILDYGAEANKRMFAASQGVSMAGGLTSKGPLTGQTISDFREQIAGTKNSAGQATPDNMLIRSKLGLSDEKLTSAYSGLSESSIDVSRSSGEMFDHFKDLSLQSIVLGKDIGELSRIFGEVMSTQNSSMNTNFKTFAKFTRQMKDSGLSANRFFGIVQSLNGSLGIYGTRLTDITDVMAKVAKYGMGSVEQQAKKFENFSGAVQSMSVSKTVAAAQEASGKNNVEGGIEVLNTLLDEIIYKLDADLTTKYIELNRAGKNAGLTQEQIDAYRNSTTHSSVKLSDEQKNILEPLYKSLEQTRSELGTKKYARGLSASDSQASFIKGSQVELDFNSKTALILKLMETAFKDENVKSTEDFATHSVDNTPAGRAIRALAALWEIPAEDVAKRFKEILPSMTKSGFAEMRGSPEKTGEFIEEVQKSGATMLSSSTTFSDAIEVFKQSAFSKSAGYIESLKSVISTEGVFAGIKKLFADLPWDIVGTILGEKVADELSDLFSFMPGIKSKKERMEARDKENISSNVIPKLQKQLEAAFGGKGSKINEYLDVLSGKSAAGDPSAKNVVQFTDEISNRLTALPEFKSQENSDEKLKQLQDAYKKYSEATKTLTSDDEKIQTKEFKAYRDLVLQMLDDLKVETLSAKGVGAKPIPIATLPKTDAPTPEELKLVEEQKRQDVPTGTGSFGASVSNINDWLLEADRRSKPLKEDSREMLSRIFEQISKNSSKSKDRLSDSQLLAQILGLSELESAGFDPSAISSIGAKGLFQVAPKTFRSLMQNEDQKDFRERYGFTGNEDINNPEEASKVGFAFFMDNLEKTFGNVIGAQAMHLVGETEFTKLLKENGYSLKDFQDKDKASEIETLLKNSDLKIGDNPTVGGYLAEVDKRRRKYEGINLPEPVSNIPSVSPFSSISGNIPTMGGGGTYAPSVTISPTINVTPEGAETAKAIVKELEKLTARISGSSWFAKGR